MHRVGHEDEIAQRLASIAEELGELAYDNLNQASSALGRGEEADPQLMAAEKRLTRARRAVEKAVQVLRDPEGDQE